MASKSKAKKRIAVAEFPKAAEAEKADASAKLYLSPSAQATAVVAEYLKGPFGAQDHRALFDTLSASVKDVWDGDTRRLEAMLFAQATALQTIFTSLARRAHSQEYLKHLETFLRLALKAQSQSRATLEALAAIKNPPTIIARQVNAGNNVQVNNGITNAVRAPARAENIEPGQNELLGDGDGARLDSRTTGATGRSDPALAPLGQGDRAANG